jgi:hypothetical protein
MKTPCIAERRLVCFTLIVSNTSTFERPGREIDPAGGKTKGCDRAKTLKTSVDRQQVKKNAGMIEAIRLTRDVKWFLSKLKGLFGTGEARK